MSRPTPGRRAARRQPGAKARAGTAAALALLSLAAAALVLTGSPLIPPGSAHPRGSPLAPGISPAATPVTHAELVCPAARGRPERHVYVGSLPGPGLPATGGVVAVPSGGTPARTAVPLSRGSLVTFSQDRGVRIEADGGMAAGLFAARVGSSTHELAAVPCDPPRTRWWFTGAGATLDHASTLTVSNVDTAPAVVDVHVLAARGPVRTVGTRGMTVAPGASRTIPLTDIAPRQDELTVGVLASRGRVVAAVRDRYSPSATAAEGSSWLPPQTPPSRVRHLAGLPAGKSSRTLLLANPERREALVSLRVSWRHGSFVPAGLEQISVGPESTVAVPVPKGPASGEASAVRVQATRPVLATVRTAARDSSYAPAVPALSGPAAAPVVTGAASRLQVTAGRTPCRVHLVAYAEDGHPVARATLAVAAAATRVWAPPGRAGYVVVDPGRGTVFAAMTYRSDRGGIASYPLREAPVLVQQPVVTPALR